MSEPYGDDLGAEEAFIASSFVDFHTEEPASPGDWIPMTEEEASERWESWIAEHDRQVAERAWDEGARWAAVECAAIDDERQEWIAPGDNPYRTEEESND